MCLLTISVHIYTDLVSKDAVSMRIHTQAICLLVYVGFRCTNSHVAWWWHTMARSRGDAGGAKPTALQHGKRDN